MRENGGGGGSYPHTLSGGKSPAPPPMFPLIIRLPVSGAGNLTPLREGERDTVQSNSHWGGA